MVYPKSRVLVINEESPLFNKEFRVKKVDLQSEKADLEDKYGNEITLPLSSIKPKDENDSPEILFEFDGTLVSDTLEPNQIVISQFKKLAVNHNVGILSHRVFDKEDKIISSFISSNFSDSIIPVVGVAGPNTKLIFSSRVVRVFPDGTDFCPMCLVDSPYTQYSADIKVSMLENTGSLQ